MPIEQLEALLESTRRKLTKQEAIPEEGRSVVYGYTHQQPDGNRLVAS